ncbi:MAG: helix-hairpin-helix domain-containing protein [Candidatus Omnitrophica bacterium]|nr:helix-hairpin-helix domain-containing protein [Candidatus Omnitrophota bacterium]
MAGFLTVCLVGSVVHYAFNRDARTLRWVKTAGTKTRPHPPDINTSTAQALDKVPGIGPKTAQNIVEYRARHGPFSSLEALRKVKGVTPRNLVRIQRYYRETWQEF